MNSKSIAAIIWTGTALVYLLPMLAWGANLDWNSDQLDPYSVFPIFGLWAFAQMWLHYAVAPIKRRNPDSFDYKPWYRVTSNLVLVFILLHPAILVFETLKNGITPFSYVDSSQLVYLLIAYVALAAFLLYDIADKFQKSSFWKLHFDKIKLASIVAMLLIFAHSLMLGSTLDEGWLRLVWFGMFLSFVWFVYDSYAFKDNSNDSLIED